jgi:DNA-binding response OmpR family regulator
MKILIADPDEVLASHYADELEEEGYLVAHCSDSEKLMDAIVLEKPDLVLIDLQMVMFPGEGFTREIMNRLSVVPPILYMSDSRFKPRKWHLSPDGFARKTRDLQALKKKINTTLFQRHKEEKQAVRVPKKQVTFLWRDHGRGHK